MQTQPRAEADPTPQGETELVDDGWGLPGESPRSERGLALRVGPSQPKLSNWWPVDEGWVLPQEPTLSAEAAMTAGAELVDLNRAEVDELCSVPGIGKGKARAIVAYRERKGAFASVDELARVRGFGAKSVAKIAAHLTV
jgi:competence protein ComEA